MFVGHAEKPLAELVQRLVADEHHRSVDAVSALYARWPVDTLLTALLGTAQVHCVSELAHTDLDVLQPSVL